MTTGTHSHQREAEDRVQGQFPAQLAERGPEQDGAEEHEGDPVEHGAHLLAEPVELLRVAAQRQAKHDAADESRDEPDPSSALAMP